MIKRKIHILCLIFICLIALSACTRSNDNLTETLPEIPETESAETMPATVDTPETIPEKDINDLDTITPDSNLDQLDEPATITPDAPDQSADTRLKALYLTTGNPAELTDKDTQTITLDEMGDDIILQTEATLYNLTISQVDTDGTSYELSTKHHEQPELTSKQAIHLKTYVPDTLPNLHIRYTDSEGIDNEYFIISNLRDGGYYLHPVSQVFQ